MKGKKTATCKTISSQESIRAWQQQLVQGVLRALVLVGPLIAAVGSYDAFTSGQTWLILFYLGTYIILILVTFWRRMPYILQAGTLLGLTYGPGVLDFFEDGRGGSGRVFLLAFGVAATLFFGKQKGILAMALAILTTLGFGWFFSGGHIVITRLTGQEQGLTLTIVRDITERKCAEAALKRYAAKLERSNRELEEFA